jgi:hypothetical protein
MVVAGLCCGQFYLAAGIRQDPACGRFWHLGDCDRVTGKPEIICQGNSEQTNSRYSVTTKITNSDGCTVWEVIEREDTLVAAARYVPNAQFLSIPFRSELLYCAAQV